MSQAQIESRDIVLEVRHISSVIWMRTQKHLSKIASITTKMFRVLAKIQDSLTRIVYGVEQQTRKMSLYACVDKDMSGNSVSVRPFIRHTSFFF
jgi:hypothetical protein